MAGNGHGEIGDRLRQERAERGLSLRELARRLDVSPSLVSQIETGKIQPSVRTLYAMVSELGVSLDDVFHADGEPAGAAPSVRVTRQNAAAGATTPAETPAMSSGPTRGTSSTSSRACAGSASPHATSRASSS